jgi:hypothetical protein
MKKEEETSNANKVTQEGGKFLGARRMDTAPRGRSSQSPSDQPQRRLPPAKPERVALDRPVARVPTWMMMPIVALPVKA